MKKIIILVLVIVVFPQIALAAWWNPLTWFLNKSSTAQFELNVPNTKQTGQSEFVYDELSVSEPKTIEKQVITEVPVEKVITKTVPIEKIVEKPVLVSDPKLISENIDLKSKIKELEAKLIEYQPVHLRNNDLTDQISESRVELNECREDLEKKQDLVNNLQAKVNGLEKTLSDNVANSNDLINKAIADREQEEYSFFMEMWHDQEQIDPLHRLCDYVRYWNHNLKAPSAVNRACTDLWATYIRG